MTHSKQAPKSSPKSQKPSTASNVLFAIAVLAVVGVGAFLFLRPSAPQTPAAQTSSAAAATPTTSDPDGAAQAAQPVSSAESVPTAPAKARPPADAPLPELPLGSFTPARPVDQVREAFHFAATHPDVLQYVPCFCGCETRGHVGNDDCFVTARDAQGRVTAWEPHGVSCQVCIDVATDARRMYSSGASVAQIRTAVENKYRPMAASMTPTPMPEKPGTK